MAARRRKCNRVIFRIIIGIALVRRSARVVAEQLVLLLLVVGAAGGAQRKAFELLFALSQLSEHFLRFRVKLVVVGNAGRHRGVALQTFKHVAAARIRNAFKILQAAIGQNAAQHRVD